MHKLAIWRINQMFFFRASLQNVLFPSVTLCNINQGRNSLFHAYGLSKNKTLLNLVLRQAYFGAKTNLSHDQVSSNHNIMKFL